MTRLCYLIMNCLSNDGVFKFDIARVSGLLVQCPLIFLYFIHTWVGSS